jgi:hypothetical protein
MTPRVRRTVRTAIGKIVVLALAAAAACSATPPDPPSALGLPSRSRRNTGAEDAGPNVLEPIDSGPIDTGPPPDPFCLEPGLVLCFTFDAAVENLVATSPKLTPAKVGEVTLVDGKKDMAAQFGVGSTLTFDHSPQLEMQAATIETWVNLDLASIGNDTIFDDDARFTMTIESDGTLRCNTPSATARGGKITVETWTHIACVFDGTAIEAYVDGVEVASVAGVVGSSSTTGAAIGDDAPDGGDGFTGELDSLRVFAVARSAAQISASAQN